MSDRAIVVDASVAVKWLIQEERSAQAVALLRGSSDAGDRLVAPPLLPVEVTNALYQRFRRRDASAAAADAAIALFFQIEVEILSPPDLVRQAYVFARDHGLKNIYDCLYVVLARELATEFWTDDRRLLTHIAPAAPWVRWLGEYEG